MIAGIAILSMLLLQSPSVPAQEDAKPAATAPQATEKPLPDVKELLNDVQHNEMRAEKLRNEYTYHLHMEEEDYDNKGGVKKSTVTESESLSIDGIRVNRVVAKDGKPLTENEKKKEDEKVDKLVAKGKDRRAQLAAKGKPSADHGEELMPASRFLELGLFANERREMLNGRSAIVLDYTGDPHAKTKTEFEGIIRDLTGTVWVDEADHAVAKVEGHFTKDFKIGAGLIANIHGGLSFNYRSSKVNDEVWLPAEIEGKGVARLLLFVKVNGRLKVVMSDYRKYRTGVTIRPGNRAIGPDGQVVPDPQEPVSPSPGDTPAVPPK